MYKYFSPRVRRQTINLRAPKLLDTTTSNPHTHLNYIITATKPFDTSTDTNTTMSHLNSHQQTTTTTPTADARKLANKQRRQAGREVKSSYPPPLLARPDAIFVFLPATR